MGLVAGLVGWIPKCTVARLFTVKTPQNQAGTPERVITGTRQIFFRYSSVRPISSVCLSVTAREQLAFLCRGPNPLTKLLKRFAG